LNALKHAKKESLLPVILLQGIRNYRLILLKKENIIGSLRDIPFIKKLRVKHCFA
jgi:hypothetical protein